MKILPEIVQTAWSNREGPIVLSTVNASGIPNAIYASCVQLYDASHLIVADNYFSKTRSNLLETAKGSVLFLTKEGKSFQIKGHIEYHKEGPFYTNMKEWNPAKHPGHAAAVLCVEEAYSGSEKLL
ncbi:MAG: pyridoxamine 5'-phosphate oxidase family protein [Opitutales bacterium]|nr:pyridoxamine 5'-phosphate oxidase family protein [Opitutales bacterium]